jgi:DNA-binding NarL/FixJ family response regulator
VEAVAQIAHTNPDALIVDLNLPDGNGLDLVRLARKNSSKIAIVVLTMSDDARDLISAMDAGASGFVRKSAPLSELISVIRRAIQAPTSFTSSGLASALRMINKQQLLTQRELEVLRALTLIGDIKTLAKNMNISESTFKTHTGSIYRKLQVSNRMSAVTLARELGII